MFCITFSEAKTISISLTASPTAWLITAAQAYKKSRS